MARSFSQMHEKDRFQVLVLSLQLTLTQAKLNSRYWEKLLSGLFPFFISDSKFMFLA